MLVTVNCLFIFIVRNVEKRFTKNDYYSIQNNLSFIYTC